MWQGCAPRRPTWHSQQRGRHLGCRILPLGSGSGRLSSARLPNYLRSVEPPSAKVESTLADAGAAASAAHPPEWRKAMPMFPRRVDKFLYGCGMSTDRAKALCREGRVTVDGTSVKGSALVDPALSEVAVDGEVQTLRPPGVYAMLHKPLGLLSTMQDPHGRPCVSEVVPWGPSEGVTHIGRLDAQTTGLLIFTDDGDLNHLLTRPGAGVWKMYYAMVTGHVDSKHEGLQQLRYGVSIRGRRDDATLPAHVGKIQHLPAEPQNPKGSSVIPLAIQEGRHHQVKRMLGVARLKCKALHREAIGPLQLGDLKVGEWRKLLPAEVEQLYAAAGGELQIEDQAAALLLERVQRGTLDARESRMVEKYLANRQRSI